MPDKTWIGSTATIGFDSGSTEPTAGDLLEGATSGATGMYVSSTGGPWAGAATGVLTLRAVSGTFADDELINNTSTLDDDVLSIDYSSGAFADNAGDFAVAANWSPSGVPADADKLIFNGLADTVPSGYTGSPLQTVGTSFSVTDNLVQNTKNFVSIIVTSEYSGKIGYGQPEGSSTYNALRCAADEVIFAGGGELHLVAEHTGADEIDSVASTSDRGETFLGKGATNGQAIGEVINSGRAKIEILSALLSTLGAPEVDNITCTSRQGEITIADDNSSATLFVRAVDGSITGYCNVATLEVSGGTFNWGADDVTPSSARTITLAEILQGSLIWNIAGTISECKIYAGKLTLSGSGVKIIGDQTKNSGVIEVHSGSLDLTKASSNISLATNAKVKRIGAGLFLPPPFSTVVWTN